MSNCLASLAMSTSDLKAFLVILISKDTHLVLFKISDTLSRRCKRRLISKAVQMLINYALPHRHTNTKNERVIVILDPGLL